MNNRGTYIMLGVVGAVLLALGVVAIRKDKGPLASGQILASLNAAQLKEVDITGFDLEFAGGPTLSFFREDSQTPWKMTKPIATRVSGTEINDIVKQMLEVKAVEKVKDLTPNRKQHGLETPSVVAKLYNRGERTGSISLGDITYGEQPLLFVLSSDEPLKPQAIRKSDLRSLFKATPPKDPTGTADLVRGVNDFRPLQLLRETFGDVLVNTEGFRAASGKSALAIQKVPGGVWNFIEPANFGSAEADAGSATAPEDVNSVRRLLETALNIAVATPADFIDDLSDLKKMGLEAASNPNLLRIEIDRVAAAGGKIALLVGNMVGDKVDQHYVRVEGEAFAAKVASSPIRAIQKLLGNPRELRDKTFATVAAGKVDAIDVAVNGETFSLRQTAEIPPGWKVYDAAGKVSVASTTSVEALVAGLGKPRTVVDFPAAGKTDADLGLATPVVAVKLWYGGIVAPKAGEKVDPNAKPAVGPTADVEMLFGKSDVAARFARRIEAGQKFDALVTEDLFRVASKTRLEYLDPAVKSFAPDNVGKLSFTRGGELFTLEKDIKGVWTIASPEARKGRNADAGKVGAILSILSGMRAGKIVADQADAASLGRLKLTAQAPKLKVTLFMIGDKSEKVYLFGDETADKLNVYALPPDSTLVIEVGKAIPEAFDGEIQDMVIYRLNESKITRLKLTGWKEILSAPGTKEVVLKDGKWAFKADPGYPIDAALVTNFIQDIVAPKGEEILPGKAADPAYGLDVNKDAIVIEIEEDGKLVTLTVGKSKDDRTVYVTSSKQPGDVYTLLSDRFKGIRKPGVFAGK